MHQKLAPDPFLILLNDPKQPLETRNSLKSNVFWMRIPFESWKCGKEGKKSQKIKYLENEKSFLDEIKNIFHSF